MSISHPSHYRYARSLLSEGLGLAFSTFDLVISEMCFFCAVASAVLVSESGRATLLSITSSIPTAPLSSDCMAGFGVELFQDRECLYNSSLPGVPFFPVADPSCHACNCEAGGKQTRLVKTQLRGARHRCPSPCRFRWFRWLS